MSDLYVKIEINIKIMKSKNSARNVVWLEKFFIKNTVQCPKIGHGWRCSYTIERQWLIFETFSLYFWSIIKNTATNIWFKFTNPLVSLNNAMQ